MKKIFPRNLPAQRLARTATGNPVTTRLESGVANCYPGLDFDHRNLDRKFFPGLVFNFVDRVSIDDAFGGRVGAHLVSVDTDDPALVPSDKAPEYERTSASKLRDSLRDVRSQLQSGQWFLSKIAQDGYETELIDHSDPKNPGFLGGGVVWRLVRSLRPERCTIELSPRSPSSKPPVELQGWRRRFVDSRTGLIDPAYKPGELSQSLCSPWTHDFRDCSCTYWASNHPDIALAEVPFGGPTLPTGATADPLQNDVYVDWLRRDRSPAGLTQAPGTRAGVRDGQIDHYEINFKWKELALVLEGRESSGHYRPAMPEDGPPFSTDELVAHLVFAAGIEHVLALEYLYARYSIKSPDEVGTASEPLHRFVEFARHELLMIAVGEMRHLRWANQILWTLQKAGLVPSSITLPSLQVSDSVPVGDEVTRPRVLANFDGDSLRRFIVGERPSGAVDGLYARVVSTFRAHRSEYPSGLLELTEEIIADGVNHFGTFSQLRSLQAPFDPPNGSPPIYSRNLNLGSTTNPDINRCLRMYNEIVDDLGKAYAFGDAEDAKYIPPARQLMTGMDALADDLGERGIGVPFFK